MKICHLTSTHPPDDARISREMATLRRAGHTVSVMGIPPGSPKRQHLISLIRLAVKAYRTEADIFHCHEPDALVIGLLQKLRGAQVVYDVHEHWPSEIPHDIGVPQALAPIIALVERRLARRADAVVAVSESVGARFDRPVILPNYPDIDPATPAAPPTLNLHTYSCMAAKIQAYHGVPEALAAVEQLKSEWDDVHLTLIGNVAVSIPPDSPVTCTGYLPQDQIAAAMQSAGVGLVLLQPKFPNIRIGLPNKLFSCMAAGVPVIASDLPEIRRVVDDARCGILVSPGSVDEIVAAAHYLARRPEEAAMFGRNGREAILSRYHWPAVEDRLLTVYEGLGVEPPKP